MISSSLFIFTQPTFLRRWDQFVNSLICGKKLHFTERWMSGVFDGVRQEHSIHHLVHWFSRQQPTKNELTVLDYMVSISKKNLLSRHLPRSAQNHMNILQSMAKKYHNQKPPPHESISNIVKLKVIRVAILQSCCKSRRDTKEKKPLLKWHNNFWLWSSKILEIHSVC